jgi:hypothetical protein
MVLLASTPLFAVEYGHVMGIPHELPNDFVFDVNINKIDGREPVGGPSYAVPAGEVTLVVSLVLDTIWTPKLKLTHNYIYSKEMTFKVEHGKTYEIAAKVDSEATDAQQKTGDFWEPVIHKVYNH